MVDPPAGASPGSAGVRVDPGPVARDPATSGPDAGSRPAGDGSAGVRVSQATDQPATGSVGSRRSVGDGRPARGRIGGRRAGWRHRPAGAGRLLSRRRARRRRRRACAGHSGPRRGPGAPPAVAACRPVLTNVPGTCSSAGRRAVHRVGAFCSARGSARPDRIRCLGYRPSGALCGSSTAAASGPVGCPLGQAHVSVRSVVRHSTTVFEERLSEEYARFRRRARPTPSLGSTRKRPSSRLLNRACGGQRPERARPPTLRR